MAWIALHRCQFLSPFTAAEAESLNFTSLLGGWFSVVGDRDDFLQRGGSSPLPAGNGGSCGVSTCCDNANIYGWIKTRVWFLQAFPCKPHSGGLRWCLALATCWHHCLGLWQISEAAARDVEICWAAFCWVLPGEKLNHCVSFRFCFSLEKLDTIKQHEQLSKNTFFPAACERGTFWLLISKGMQ